MIPSGKPGDPDTQYNKLLRAVIARGTMNRDKKESRFNAHAPGGSE